MKTIFFLIILSIIPVKTGVSGEQPTESTYCDRWCIDHEGKSEYVLPNKTRCDCLTNTHAIEFDFANKWYEALGQALFYASQTGKKAGVVLILRSEKDSRYWIRLNATIKYHSLPVDTWTINR